MEGNTGHNAMQEEEHSDAQEKESNTEHTNLKRSREMGLESAKNVIQTARYTNVIMKEITASAMAKAPKVSKTGCGLRYERS